MSTTQSGATLGMSGSYNAHSSPQLVAIELSIPYIRKAIDALDVTTTASLPLIIADFGSAHGANSIYAMKTIIDHLRETKKDVRPPLVVHNDLSTNDWTSLFKLLADENSYNAVASGHSFYEQCLPNNSLSIGYSSTSINWLSKKPCNLSNHCASSFASGDELVAFKSQAHLDYIHFLENRSRELLPGGVLILASLCVNDQGNTGHEDTHQLLYKCAQALPLTPQELLDYTIPSYLRSYEECVDEELFARYSLQLIKSDFVSMESPLFMQWQGGHTTLEKFACMATSFVRSWSESALRQALEMNKQRTKEEIDRVLDQFWTMHEGEVKERPHEHRVFTYRTYWILKKLPLA